MSYVTNWEKVKRTVLHYFWGCFANSFNGAVTAIYGYLGLAVGSVVDPDNITAPSMHTLWVIFSVKFVMDVFGYFKAHPLPEKFPDIEDEFPPLPPPREMDTPVPSAPGLKINPDEPFKKLSDSKLP